jgi:hypothetical protein
MTHEVLSNPSSNKKGNFQIMFLEKHMLIAHPDVNTKVDIEEYLKNNYKEVWYIFQNAKRGNNK